MTVLFRRPRLLVAAVVAVLLVAATGVLALRWTRASSAGSLDMVARLDFQCTLPVVAGSRLATISLPDGAVSDSAASIGPHDEGDSYFRGRWLPVSAAWVSPDGGSYAYVTETSGAGTVTSTLFVHGVASGTDRAVWTEPGQVMGATWAPGGVYLNVPSTTGPGSRLWVVDPAHPASAHVVGPNPPPATQAGSFPGLMLFGVAGGAAWAITPSRQPAGGGGAVVNDVLTRMDLRDGHLTTWFQAPAGFEIGLTALDPAGRMLVGLAPAPVEVGNVVYSQAVRELRLVTGRNASAPVPMPDPNMEPDGGFADQHGIWLTGPGSLWLYRNGRLLKVAGVSANVAPLPREEPLPAGVPSPRPGGVLRIAGPCA